MSSAPETVALTGAAGSVGSALREPLSALAGRVLLIDRAPMTAHSPAEEVRQADLSGLEPTLEALRGADAVVHLAGIADEAPLDALLQVNVLGTQHVLEACRRLGIRRVVLASSNRLTGCYPVTAVVSTEDPPRPDGLYGVAKVATEALGRLYVDKFGLEVVCLRIGSFEQEPGDARNLATWLSPGDLAGFVRAALTTPDVGFLTAYAVSANTRRFWELTPSLGYTPTDDAEDFAGRFPDADAFFAGGPQGGHFAAPGYTERHLG